MHPFNMGFLGTYVVAELCNCRRHFRCLNWYGNMQDIYEVLNQPKTGEESDIQSLYLKNVSDRYLCNARKN